MMDEDQTLFLVAAIVILFLYMLPTVIAFVRGHANRWIILVLNILFGTTGLGWLGCLVWAFHAIHRTADPAGSHGGESGLNLTVNDPVRLQISGHQQAARADLDGRLLQLEKIGRLREDRIITEAEFESLRRQAFGA